MNPVVRSVAEEEELQRLIEEQRRDMRAGSFQRPQWFATLSLDRVCGLSGEMTLQDFVSYEHEDDFRPPASKTWIGCGIHGKAFMVPSKGSNRGMRCGECRRQTDRLRYQTNAADRERRRARSRAKRRAEREVKL